MGFTEKEEAIRASVAESLDGVSVSIVTTQKNNYTVHGLQFNDGKGVSPIIYLQEDSTSQSIIARYKAQTDSLAEMQARSKDISDLLHSFESAKDSIVMRLVPIKGNSGYIADKPYTPWLDLAIIYACEVGDIGSVVITHKIASAWHVTVTDLDRAAKANMPRLSPINVRTMDMVMEELGVDDAESCDAMVVSNKAGFYGAAVITTVAGFKALCKLSEQSGKNYYILPSSVHEVLLMPDKGTPCTPDVLRQMIQMIHEVNITQVDPGDRLSDSLYYYNRGDGAISICTE
jgi:hypothetical protein